MAAEQVFTTQTFKTEEIPAADENTSREDLFALYKKQNETIQELTRQIANLSETVAFLTRKLYGVSREKLPFPGQIDLFGNVAGGNEELQQAGSGDLPAENAQTGAEDVMSPEEALKNGTAEQKLSKKPRSRRKNLFSGVEVEKVSIPLSEEELTCQLCGAKMDIIGEEYAREEFQITPMQIKRVQYYRETAACSNCKEEYGSFAYIKSEVPAPLIDHSMASASAVSYIAHQRTVNCMTYYRLEKEMENRGLPLGRETMASWIIFCALNILQPMYDLLFEELLRREVLHGDETWCQVLHEKGKPATSKSYIWLIVTGEDGLPPIDIYYYAPTRAHDVPETLPGRYTGFFHTDKYDGYNCLEDHITRCLCWAHGRRKWWDAMPDEIRKRDRTGLSLDDLTPAEIGFLYCEKILLTDKKLKDLDPDQKKARRLSKEKPVIKSF